MPGLEGYAKEGTWKDVGQVRRDFDAVIEGAVTFPEVEKHKSNSSGWPAGITAGITQVELDS